MPDKSEPTTRTLKSVDLRTMKKERIKNHVPKGTYQSRADKQTLDFMIELHEHVARMCKFIMGKRGITQQELADHLGISVPALRDRLSGKTNIPVEEVVVIADFLKVDVRAFIDMDMPLRQALFPPTKGLVTRSEVGSIKPTLVAVKGFSPVTLCRNPNL